MRLFTKIFLCTIAVVTVALSVTGYRLISDSLNNSVARETQRGLEEYQLLKFTLQSGILSAEESGSISTENIKTIAQQTANLAPSGNQTAILALDKSVIFSDFPPEYDFSIIDSISEQTIIHTIESRADEYWLIAAGKFSQSDMTLRLVTARNITPIIEEKQAMERSFIVIFLIVLLISAAILIGLSALLTSPIKKLAQNTRRFTNGKYDERAIVKSSDEIGELSRSFNRMARTIQETIEQLELNAQQKEDFVANFAHELKTPLTSVIGYADMIYQNESLTRREIKDAAGYIVNEGMRLEALSLKLMELIILNKHDFAFMQMRMDEVLHDIADTLLPIIRRKNIELNVSAHPAYVRIEFDLFKTLLLNLIDNAIKADSEHISLCGRIDGTSYVVTVADDGHGIPKDQLDRIAEAFYMVDKSRSRAQHGAGLGLAIASRIAELHKTKLEYVSEVNLGTTVRISLDMEDNAL